MKRTIAIVAAALVLGGCGSKEVEKPNVKVSASPTQIVAQRYDSNQDLVAALNSGKVWCAGYQDTASIIDALQLGSCFNGDDELVLHIYEDAKSAATAANDHALMMDGLFDDPDYVSEFVVGPNWLVDCGSWSPGCTQIVLATGGRYTKL